MHNTRRKAIICTKRGKNNSRRKNRQKGGNNRKKSLSSHCSPFAERNAVIAGSCFTRDALVEMQRAYNASESNKPSIISGTDPVKIWNQLRDKMPQKCSSQDPAKQELCWVTQIRDEGLRKRLDDELFVPKRPREWAGKPNAWLSNYDISEVMEQYVDANPQFMFIGPSSIDFAAIKGGGRECIDPKLCALSLKKKISSGKTDIGIVLNLDTHDGPGTHWVSIFIRLCPSKPFMFYFNSTGESEPPEIIAFREKMQADYPGLKYYSSSAEHQRSNTECGMYSLVFLVSMVSREHPETETPMTDQQLIRMYTDTDNRISDSTIEKFRHIYFR
jgi:hypothetical protein